MIKGTKTFYMDDEGVFHKAAEETFYFENEVQREEFVEAIEEGRIKMVVLCKDCRKWLHTTNGNICEETGGIRCYDEFCSRGESR